MDTINRCFTCKNILSEEQVYVGSPCKQCKARNVEMTVKKKSKSLVQDANVVTISVVHAFQFTFHNGTGNYMHIRSNVPLPLVQESLCHIWQKL